jgi:hypothetical protein
MSFLYEFYRIVAGPQNLTLLHCDLCSQETQEATIDITRPHVVMDKMDGCLVGAFKTEGKIRFGSKMGVTDVRCNQY